MTRFTRAGIAACLLALASLINPNVARAQNYRNCAWPITASPDGSGNLLVPENNERFFLMNFDTSYQTMTIKGTYPHARYFSFVVYDGESPVDVAGHLIDSQITPDPGSGVNPFVQSGPDGAYTITLSRTVPQSSANVIKVGAAFAWVAMRIYVPSEDPKQSGVALSGGVPLPAIFLGNQRLDQCYPIDKLDDVRALLNLLFPPGFDLVGSEGTPSTDRLWFAAPTVPPPTLFPNPDNKYLVMLPGDHYQPGRIIVIHGKAPGTSYSYDGSPIWQPAQGFSTVDMRYWSLCNNDFALPVGTVQCTSDLSTTLKNGNYTIAISDDLLRPDWLRSDITWLPYGDELYPKFIFFRNMLASDDFPYSIQKVLASENPHCTFNLNLPHIPPRRRVDRAGQCAETIMKDYYPVAVWCDKSTFQLGGWRACIKEH